MRQTVAMALPSSTWLMQLADSELGLALRLADGRLVLPLAAAHLRHPMTGAPGHAPGLGLVLDGAQLTGELLPGRVRDGRLWDGSRWLAEWPVPSVWHAGGASPLRLEWTGPYGDAATITARALRCELQPGAQPIEQAWQPWLHC